MKDIAVAFDMSPSVFAEEIAGMKKRLNKERAKRKPPIRDDKILGVLEWPHDRCFCTSWVCL